MSRLATAAVFLLALAAVPAAAQNAARGQELYQSTCLSCHGMPPAGGPERAGNNPQLIRDAINGRVAAMAFLRQVLTDQDIRDIAAWLANPTSGPVAPVPAFDFTDLWFNEAESGWGLNLIQHASHKVFGVMYTYDTDRKPMWLVIPDGTWSSPLVYSGPIYRVTGPPFNGATFDSTRVRVTQVGIATLTFSGQNTGTFTFGFNGVPVTKTITRQPF